MIPLLFFILLPLVWEVSFIFGFGGIALIDYIDLDNYEFNPFDYSVINNYSTPDDTPYVTNTPAFYSLLFKYYIQNRGLVFRFSRLSKQINQKYKELQNANLNA